jgi:hypothetical protein
MATKNATCLLLTGLLLYGSLGASAQRGDDQQPARTPQDATDVTMIGCLMRVDTSGWGPGTPHQEQSSPSRLPPSSGFVLKDAAMATAPTGTSGGIATKSEREYRLLKTDVPLEKFAGQQVEVKGRLGPAGRSPDTASGAAPKATRGTGGGAAADSQRQAVSTSGGDHNMLQITSVRALSTSCPPPGGRD